MKLQFELHVLIRLNRFFIWGKIAIDLIDLLRFIAIYCVSLRFIAFLCDLLRFFAIFCDFFLGNQIRHWEKIEEDCRDLLLSMVSLLGTVESSK